jgi:regulator of protease activity HflC (stomatin/prohibitin superfamily)
MKKTLIASIIAILTLTACEQIDTGHRGVRVTFGEVDEKAGSLSEGLYFYNIFTSSIKEMDTRVQRAEGTANTYTKDVQQADIKYVVNFHLDPNAAHTMYKTVGMNWYAALVPQAVEGIMKQVVGHYDAVDLIEHRGKATEEIQKAIADSLKSKLVIIDRVELVNIQYHKAFEKAVEEKVVAVQKAVEEKNRTVQVQEQAKQQIISAQAQAESMRIRSNALLANPKLVEYEAVQKWDGKLPQYMLGNSVPFVNMNPK